MIVENAKKSKQIATNELPTLSPTILENASCTILALLTPSGATPEARIPSPA